MKAPGYRTHQNVLLEPMYYRLYIQGITIRSEGHIMTSRARIARIAVGVSINLAGLALLAAQL
jgi:hypothetical protein